MRSRMFAMVVVSMLALVHAARAQSNVWVQRGVSGPSARHTGFMAFDSARGETILFGGNLSGSDSGPFSGETWAWNGTSWTLRATTGPSPRSNSQMCYDSGRGVVVLFGGWNGSIVGETWEWNGAAWTQRVPSGASPSARSDAAMCYDSARGRCVLFGGASTASGAGRETWEWDGAAWSLRATNGPTARLAHAMAYDSARHVSVLFGGSDGNFSNETWEWNGAAWSLRATTGPSPRYAHGMAYDRDRAVTVLFGGYPYSSDTWEWNGTAWTQQLGAGPSARYGVRPAYDSLRHRFVAFGGVVGGGLVSETWEHIAPPVVTDWTSYTATQATGTLAGTTVTLTTSEPNAFNGSITNGSSTWLNYPVFFPSLATSDLVFFFGRPSPVTYTLTFSQPVTNPLLHLQSLASTITFDGVNPIRVAGQPTFTVTGNQVIGDFGGSGAMSDANGSVVLPGTFTSITFHAQWNNAIGDGIGMHVGLLPDGALSLPMESAGPTDNAVAGDRADPGSSGPPTTLEFNSLTVQPGSSFTLGSNETLNLNNGQGTLYINAGATVVANGTILGNVLNNGLLIVPITQVGLVGHVSGGQLIIVPIIPTPPTGPNPPVEIVPSTPPEINPGTWVTVGGPGFAATNGGSSGGGGGGGGGSWPGNWHVESPSFTNEGGIAYDGELAITGSFTQSETGVLRMFIAGDVRGETYSHLAVGEEVSLDGMLQVVLQPELLGFLPSVGETFDLIDAAGGITIAPGDILVRTYMTAQGASMLGLSLPAYHSPFVDDPNNLVELPLNLFSYAIVNGGETLRVTMNADVCGPPSVSGPVDATICPSGTATFHVPAPTNFATHAWQVLAIDGITWVPLSDGEFLGVGLIAGAATPTLSISSPDAASVSVRCEVSNPCGTTISGAATLSVCHNDIDNGSGVGICDGGVDINDLLFFLANFELGSAAADLDDDGDPQFATPDGGTDINDLLFFLAHFELGC